MDRAANKSSNWASGNCQALIIYCPTNSNVPSSFSTDTIGTAQSENMTV